MDKKIKKLNMGDGFENLKEEETELLLRRKKVGQQEDGELWDSS